MLRLLARVDIRRPYCYRKAISLGKDQPRIFIAEHSMTEELSGEILAPALRVINQLETERLIGGYAIGGSFSLIFYGEAFTTDDVDIFCHITQGKGSLLVSLSPIYERLNELGFLPDGEGIRIHGVKIQFLLPMTELGNEAMITASQTTIEGVPTRVFDFEHALAMKAATGRAKDWGHIGIAMESGEPDMNKLKDILTRYNLLRSWTKHGPPID